jgi:hypothetical protein
MSRVSPQLFVFSYHKSGTSLLLHVMTKVCDRLGLTLANCFGLVDRLDLEPDVVLLPHSLLRAPLDRPYRAIRMIRDPRDIWVSGYLYHRHCAEEWCVNTDTEPGSPIQWPQVDHSFVHRPEEWKRRYLERLDGKAYQQHLLDLPEADGLAFELEGYTGCTLTAMREWILNGADAMDVKLEDMMADFDGTMLRIFDHFGFTTEQSEVALDVARSEDIRRMDDATIATRPQIHSRTISKWRDILSADQIAGFEATHGDLIRGLGYELTAAPPRFPEAAEADKWFSDTEATLATAVGEVRLVWPGLTQSPDELGTVETMTRGADVRLWADGITIRPTVTSQETYSFVVPPGANRVRLVSRRGVPADRRAPYLGAGRCLGVRVSEIVIESRAGEVVIPADDPRLVTGWHDAEHSGLGLWRWTDGSAELPWAGVSGPAVVTVRCTALGEYPVEDDAGLVEARAAGQSGRACS